MALTTVKLRAPILQKAGFDFPSHTAHAYVVSDIISKGNAIQLNRIPLTDFS